MADIQEAFNDLRANSPDKNASDKCLWKAAGLSFLIGFLLFPLAAHVLFGKYRLAVELLGFSGPIVGTLLLVVSVRSYSGSFKNMLKTLDIRKVPAVFVSLALPIGLCISIISGMLTALWQKLAAHYNFVFDMPDTEAIARHGNNLQVLILVISALLMAPFFEEILFRKVLYEFVRWRGGRFAALLVAPFVFALVHASLLQLPGLFFMAVIWQVIYLRTRNLSFTMILHLCNNLFAVIALLISRQIGNL